MRARYAAGLATAFLLTAAEVTAIVVTLGVERVAGAEALLTARNLFAVVGLIAAGVLGTTVGGLAALAPAFRRLSDGRDSPESRRATTNITARLSAALLTPWAVAAGVLIALNLRAGAEPLLVIITAAMFGATATVCTGFLFTQRTLRPLMAVLTTEVDQAEVVPGVRGRLVLMWTVCTALPGAGIVTLVALQRLGLLVDDPASIELPVLVLALVAVLLGLRTLIVVSRSISDPVHDVVEAMGEIERGGAGRLVDVYDRSEIGHLQSGFNRMVIGLQERDRLRDLFGRHVGPEVVRRAEAATGAEGGVRYAAILFVDLVGSTRLAIGRDPQRVAELLNDFFQVVVAAVDHRHGLINKFQGDAALAVFGVPLAIDRPADAALATARTLAAQLRSRPLDFGIGVSAGPVFAGNIGAENRYEYTVIGDPVNEAARLADQAKASDERVLCSGAVCERADPQERSHWSAQGEVLLRGRVDPTPIFTPCENTR
ncbi:adenylate/guanylate cyclase domain-containing protein [Mycolicibacterium monacense]|uniref:Adenylate cyclase n=4 Tax=Mycobacteriaceae TaxID=1762 RepID=A0AAD1IT25_MYCMB|nr:adenylate/guanylate cyclase domain-containing protein [Mycolicibacterium monacense]MDA4103036.1 cyclase [Mycolicibacterium monacense DSM 44395]OBB77792.1 cyclase [Mycolicibacterium monacense]ORB18048.1 adenylate/guanylate cyclase domain-containing protein [Mycolicibacterium monacense DSM 44395]QHP87385.1 adenylate/guanylate cyclase domain-containing protein [Mycolicibacterium monacense DSM 44395]BBZ59490.1 adenylate cyclase [Mycolicibacterium monacense]